MNTSFSKKNTCRETHFMSVLFFSFSDATFPTVTPPRLQLFEYESVSINCRGVFKYLSKWRVMRNIRGTDTICNIRVEITGTCTIATAFSTDSGEYWCEAEGKKSNSVNIIVTGVFNT